VDIAGSKSSLKRKIGRKDATMQAMTIESIMEKPTTAPRIIGAS
jgi:hypothetical protein